VAAPAADDRIVLIVFSIPQLAAVLRNRILDPKTAAKERDEK
jgi:hypothetical protein